MKNFYITALFSILAFASYSQTWNGSLSSDWNTAGNWDGGQVPNSSGNVVINAGASNWPSLSGDVTVNGFRMNTGSRITLNGRTINTGGTSASVVVDRAIINGNGQFNLAGTATKSIDGTTVNGNLVINVNGRGNFQEASLAANTFNGNLAINMNESGNCTLSNLFSSSYNGNLTVNRSVAGISSFFVKGSVTLTGNFTFNNLIGGDVTIGDSNTPLSLITGTININFSNTISYSTFVISRIKNLTSGGKIKAKSSQAISFFAFAFNDTLRVDSLIFENFQSAGISNSQLTAALYLKQFLNTSSSTPYYVTNNAIFGNSTIIIYNETLSNNFAEANNIFNGDVNFDLTGNGSVGISYQQPSTYRSNLTINSYHEGSLSVFDAGCLALDGNFTFTGINNIATFINSHCLRMPAFGGSVTIDLEGDGIFEMRRVKNNTPGGFVRVQKMWAFQITRDTLSVDSIVIRNILEKTGPLGYDSLYYNSISGNIRLEDKNNSSNLGVRFGENVIGGVTQISIMDGSTAFYDDGANVFNGNVEYTLDPNPVFTQNTAFEIGHLFPSAYHGDVKITRNRGGIATIFPKGFTALDGHFTYINNFGATTAINPDSYPTALIGKSVNIQYNSPTGTPGFNMRRIKNALGGGSVVIRNAGLVSFFSDTLIVDSIVLRDFSAPGTTSEHGLANCKITGNLTVVDKATNNRPIYLFGNIIDGNTDIQVNSNAGFNQGFFNRDRFNGNLRISNNGASTVTFSGPVHFDGSLILNSNAGIAFTDTVYFGGSSNSSIEQLGTQSILIPRIAIRKTNNSSLSLLDTIIVSTIARFESGNFNAITRPLRFADNATYTGASSVSHVNGKVLKAGNDAFSFPVGAATTLNTVSMTAPANTTDLFAAEYIQRNPTTDGYNITSFQQIAPNPIKRVSKCEYWNLQRLNGSSNVSLNFSYGDLICPAYPGAYITNPANAKIVHWNGSIWEDLGNGGYTGAAIGTVSTAAAVSSFSPFTIASTDINTNPLPLTLLSFNAFENGPMADLKWETTNEQNVSHYEIQRAGNDNQFAAIGTVASVNSSSNHTYNFTDRSPKSGLNFYRLMSVDIDGKISYSKTVFLNFDDQQNVQLWPNPVSRGAVTRLFIPNGNGLTNVRMMNSQGKVIRQWYNVNAGSIIEIRTGEIPGGLYLVQVGDAKTVRLVIN